MNLPGKIKNKIQREWRDRKNIGFRIDRAMHRFFIKHSLNNRPSSAPYISGDTFRTFAQHILDEQSSIEPKNVKNRDVVFVKTSFIKEFFTKIHPDIQTRYILITHNSDEKVDEELVSFIDDKIIMWFAQNATLYHPKITPIPIGLENLFYYNNGITKNFDKTQANLPASRKPLILYGFNVATNWKARQEALSALSTLPTAEKILGWPNQRKYLKILSHYNFVASPQGNGPDCHRTWEALNVNTIPIVERSYLTEHFKRLGIPLLIIDDWNDLKKLSTSDLDETYKSLMNTFDNSSIKADYWIEQIKKLQQP